MARANRGLQALQNNLNCVLRIVKIGIIGIKKVYCMHKKERRLTYRETSSFLRVPGLEPGAVYRPDVPN